MCIVKVACVYSLRRLILGVYTLYFDVIHATFLSAETSIPLNLQ